MHRTRDTVKKILVGFMFVALPAFLYAQDGGAGSAPPPPPGGNAGGTVSQPPPPPTGGSEMGETRPPEGNMGGPQMPPPPGRSEGGFRQPPPPPQGGEFNPEDRPFNDRNFRPEGKRSEDGRFEPPRRSFEGDESGEAHGNQETGDGSERMEKERLSQAKRNIHGLERGIQVFKKTISRLTARGVSIPAEYGATLSELESAIQTIKNATEWSDAVEAAMGVIEEKGETLREMGPKLGALERWPREVKRAESELKRLTSQIGRAKAKTGTEKYGAIISGVESALEEASATLEKAKVAAAGGELDTALETLHDSFFDALEEARSGARILENIANAARLIKNTEREITRFRKTLDRLEKKSLNTSDLRSSLDELESRVRELKAATASGDLDPDPFFETMREIESFRREIANGISRLMGETNRTSQPSRSFRNAEGAVIKALDLLKTL